MYQIIPAGYHIHLTPMGAGDFVMLVMRVEEGALKYGGDGSILSVRQTTQYVLPPMKGSYELLSDEHVDSDQADCQWIWVGSLDLLEDALVQCFYMPRTMTLRDQDFGPVEDLVRAHARNLVEAIRQAEQEHFARREAITDQAVSDGIREAVKNLRGGNCSSQKA